MADGGAGAASVQAADIDDRGDRMSRVVLSAGSNMGDPVAHLRSVVEELGESAVAVSSVYVTAPWGGVEQADFHNLIVIAEDSGRGAWDWLRLCHLLEWRAQRVRGMRWGPRSLDVDIVAYAAGGHEVRSRHPDLLLPHPRAHLRAFVLVPWAEIEPQATLGGTPIAELIDALGRDELAGVTRAARGSGRAAAPGSGGERP